MPDRFAEVSVISHDGFLRDHNEDSVGRRSVDHERDRHTLRRCGRAAGRHDSSSPDSKIVTVHCLPLTKAVTIKAGIETRSCVASCIEQKCTRRAGAIAASHHQPGPGQRGAYRAVVASGSQTQLRTTCRRRSGWPGGGSDRVRPTRRHTGLPLVTLTPMLGWKGSGMTRSP